MSAAQELIAEPVPPRFEDIMTLNQPIWDTVKDRLVRAGLEPWLKPIADTIRGREPDADELAARSVIAGLPDDAVCVDVGCHKGFYLDPMRKRATRGRFFAFEPIPILYDRLKYKYRNDPRVVLFNMALSAENGTAELFINDSDMGLSGLSRRPGRHGIDQTRLKKTAVPMRRLDDVLIEERVDFIKIDVEGAEFDVLCGARSLVDRSRPIILFEFGLGGADYFGVDADAMFSLFQTRDFAIYRVPAFARAEAPLSRSEFVECFVTNSAFNFVAAPRHTGRR